MIGIVILIMGIIGFVKGKLKVSAKKELSGAPMYVVCAMMCAYLPLSYVAGLVLRGMIQPGSVSQRTLMTYAIMIDFGLLALLIVIAAVIATVYAKPIPEPVQSDTLPPPPPTKQRGFQVKV